MLKGKPKSIYYDDNYGILHSHFKGPQTGLIRLRVLHLENSADPDDIPLTMWDFIWVFSVCQRSCLQILVYRPINRNI